MTYYNTSQIYDILKSVFVLIAPDFQLQLKSPLSSSGQDHKSSYWSSWPTSRWFLWQNTTEIDKRGHQTIVAAVLAHIPFLFSQSLDHQEQEWNQYKATLAKWNKSFLNNKVITHVHLFHCLNLCNRREMGSIFYQCQSHLLNMWTRYTCFHECYQVEFSKVFWISCWILQLREG